MMHDDKPYATRRRFLIDAAAIAGSLGVGLSLTVTPVTATPETLRTAIKRVVGEGALKRGKVKLDLPPLVENGNVVPLTVSVDSPMTAEDYVKAITSSTRRTRSRTSSPPISARARDARACRPG